MSLLTSSRVTTGGLAALLMRRLGMEIKTNAPRASSPPSNHARAAPRNSTRRLIQVYEPAEQNAFHTVILSVLLLMG